METTPTSGQLGLQQKVFDEKMTPDRWRLILSSGIFADLCDPDACLDDRDAIRAALKLDELAKQSKLLTPDGHCAAVKMKKRHDPDAFWQACYFDDIYVHADFRKYIVAAAKPIEAGTKYGKVSRFKLYRDATCEELKSARPNSIWTATNFCPWLAEKIKNHLTSELIHNDEDNLFFVEGVGGEVFVVSVHWSIDHRRWYIHTHRLSHEWPAGSRFVSHN